MNYTWWAKKWGHYVWRLISSASKCPNQFPWFLAYFHAVLF